MSDNKKKLLGVRLTELGEDTPETLRIIEQARAGMGLSSEDKYDFVDEIMAEHKSRPAPTPEEAQPEPPKPEPVVSLGSVASGEIQPEHITIDNTDDTVKPDREDTEEIPIADMPQEVWELPDERSTGRRILDRVIYILSGVIPGRGDPPLEIVRKCVFIAALITFIVSLSYIVNDMVIVPMKNEEVYNSLRELYNPDNPAEPPADFPKEKYPEGISDSFKALYAMNDQIRGWLKYSDTNKSWLNISYPVMYSGDNKYYLNHDFQKAENKNGALFFDERTKLESKYDKNRVLIVYGHNMVSGQMFTPLNKLMNNLNYMRSAPIVSLDTLYERGEYMVFAVMLLNTREKDGPMFQYLRTSFADDQDYMNFIAEIRARSIYDFNGVDVQSSDELLIMSTCTTKSGAHFDEGRCVVVARKVRQGETVAIRASDIVKNNDVIMPLAWYVNQKKTPHKFYTDSGYTLPTSKVTTSYNTSRTGDYEPTTYPPTQPSNHTGTTSASESGTDNSSGSSESTDSSGGSATATTTKPGTTTSTGNETDSTTTESTDETEPADETEPTET